MSIQMLFHITQDATWQAAKAAGIYRAPSLTTEGFIHLSTAEQVVSTANRFYKGQPELVLLGIEEERLQAEVRYENVPSHGVFPHLYGPINVEAVEQVWDLKPERDGTFNWQP